MTIFMQEVDIAIVPKKIKGILEQVSNIYSHSWAKHSGLMTIKYFAVVYSASCNNLANYFNVLVIIEITISIVMVMKGREMSVNYSNEKDK